MNEKAEHINYLYKLTELSELMNSYAYMIKIIDKDLKRTFEITLASVSEKISKLEEIYSEIKNLDVAIFIESLLLMNEETQIYFCNLIENAYERKASNLSKILDLKDVGITYDNQYTQDLQKVQIMSKIFYFIKSNNDFSVFKRIKSVIKSTNKRRETPKQTNEKNKINIKEEEAIKNLKPIWLAESKLLIKDFLAKGIDAKIWDEDYKII